MRVCLLRSTQFASLQVTSRLLIVPSDLHYWSPVHLQPSHHHVLSFSLFFSMGIY